MLVNGNYADWVHPDGNFTKLPPYYSTISNRQTYIIRGFHQMHCLVSYAPSPQPVIVVKHPVVVFQPSG